jgi:hypothetical protein
MLMKLTQGLLEMKGERRGLIGVEENGKRK